MTSFRRILLLLLALLALLAQASSAATYYVSLTTNSPAGSDARSCVTAQTITTPKATIMGAIACVAAGDIIDVRGGTYTGGDGVIDSESVALGAFPSGTDLSTGAITVRAHSGETVIIKPINTQGIRLTRSSPAYWIFQDLIIDGSSGSMDTTGGFNLSYPDLVYSKAGGHVRYLRMELRNNAGNGYQFAFDDPGGTSSDFNEVLGGSVHDNGVNQSPTQYMNTGYGFYLKTSSNLISGVDIYNCNGYGIHNNPGSASHGNSNTIIKNTFRNCYVRGTNASVGGSTAFAIEIGGDGNVFANNLVYGCQGGVSLYGGASSQARNTLVFNNTITESTTGFGVELQYYSTGNVVRNNIIYANGGGAIRDDGDILGHFGNYTADHNLTANPGFTNAGAHDYTISATSAAYDTGTSTSPTVTDDFIGTARPQASTYDIGAYEVIVSGSGVTIITTSLPDGQRTAAYLATATITGGTGTYSSCTVSAGTIPTGLSSSIVSNACQVSGTPSAANSFSFTLQVCDNAAACDTQAYTVDIADIDTPCSNVSSGSWTLRHCPGASSSNGTANAVTTAVDTTGSDFAACAIASDTNVTIPTMQDAKSNAWVLVGSYSATFGVVKLYYSRLTSVGSGHTFTANTGGNTSFPAIQCAVFSGSSATPFDNAAPGMAVFSDINVQAGIVKTSRSKQLVITAIQTEHANGLTINGGFTLYQRQFQSGKAFGVGLAWNTFANGQSTPNPWTNWDTTMDASATGGTFFASDSALDVFRTRRLP